MADADQSFGWWSTGDLQGSTSADSEPALYSNRHTFNQTNNIYQQPYDLNPEQHHGEAEGNNIWLPILANPNMPGPAMMHLSMVFPVFRDHHSTQRLHSPFHHHKFRGYEDTTLILSHGMSR